jgi:hypothetical protein
MAAKIVLVALRNCRTSGSHGEDFLDKIEDT